MHQDPLRPHRHDNNTTPPHDDPSIRLLLPNGRQRTLTVDDLLQLPQASLHYSYTTDHGEHGPYLLEGVLLAELLRAVWQQPVAEVEVISADGFGNRIERDELDEDILLCLRSDGRPLSRASGLVRLVVPSETDNALRQVKWVATVRVISGHNYQR